MSEECPFCDGSCGGADLDLLLDPKLNWLWTQLGRAADHRGDAALNTGGFELRAPAAPDERAAALGLVGDRTLRPGQSRRLDLAELTQRLRVRGSRLTPGAVAAHALRRRLAVRAANAERRRNDEQQLLDVLLEVAPSIPGVGFCQPDRIWRELRRSGSLARLIAAPAPEHQLRLPSTWSRCSRPLAHALTGVTWPPMRRGILTHWTMVRRWQSQ